jgi:mono/diheme cytochrome c family protein
MKHSIAITALLLALASTALTAQTRPRDPKETYEQMCAGCHGTRGDGAEGHSGGFSPVVTTLANKEYMKLVNDEYLVAIIKKGGAAMGKIATMPAWEKRLTDEEIKGIVAHIRTF